MPITESQLAKSADFMRAAARATTLYELSDAQTDLWELIVTAETPEELDALKAELDGVEGVKAAKLDNVAVYSKTLEAQAQSIQAEIDKLKQRLAAREKKVEWLKAYIRSNMDSARVETARFVIRVQRNSIPTVTVVDAAAIPSEYQRVIPASVEVDRRAIGKHFADTGEVVTGTNVAYDSHLRIE